MSLAIPIPSGDYALFAQGEFTDLYGRDYLVQIEKYAPGALFLTPKPLVFQGQAIVITQHGSGSDTESPIKAQDLSLNLHSITDFQYLNFYAGNNFDYRLKLTFDGSVIWTGYVVPDQWNEAFISPPYQNTLSFIDGLSMLKNFGVEDSSGCYLTGKHTWLNFIAWMLSKTDKGCNILDSINVIEENNTYTNAGFLNDTLIDVEAFRGLNCYEALERLLYPWFQIRYVNNEYEIKRINQATNYTRIRYDYKGDFQNQHLFNPKVQLSCSPEPSASRVIWVDKSQQLEVLPAMKRIDFTQTYGRKESILKHSSFDECDFQANGNPKGWVFNGVKKKVIGERVVAEFLSDSMTSPDYGLNQYIEAQARPAYVANDETIVLEIEQGFGTMATPRQEYGARVYYGPKGPQLHERETQVNQNFMYVGIQAPYSFFYQNPGFVIKNGDYIVFPGNRPALQNEGYPALPIGFDAGIYYKVINNVYLANPPRYRFDLSEAYNPTQKINIDNADKGKYFLFKFNPMYLRTEVQTDNGLKAMNQKGDILEGMHTPMELPVNQKRDGQFFKLGFQSDPESEHQAGDGFIYLVIEKPRPIYNSVEVGREWGSYYIDKVLLYFKDTLEKVLFSLQLSGKHNQIKEVELWFGEIFKDQTIRDLDPNGVLKYYNALIFRDGSFDGALAKRFTADEVTKYFTDHIQDFFRQLYLKPRFLLRGDLDSKINLFGAVMSDTSTMRNYTTNALTWDVARCKWQVELHELEPVQTGAQAKAYDENAYDEGYN